MEAKISMEGKTPVMTSHENHEPLASEKNRQKEVKSKSRAQSSERDRLVSKKHHYSKLLAVK